MGFTPNLKGQEKSMKFKGLTQERERERERLGLKRVKKTQMEGNIQE